MEHTLSIGQAQALKRSFLGRSWSVIYAGMPNDRVYSLAVTWAVGYHSACHNLFLPVDQREVDLAGGRMSVLDVSPRELHFSFEP
jgi:hypothetical protein